MRKFAVRIVGPACPRFYLVEAETAQLAEELLEPLVDPLYEVIWWADGESREWREAWRAGTVEILKDRKLPDDLE